MKHSWLFPGLLCSILLSCARHDPSPPSPVVERPLSPKPVSDAPTQAALKSSAAAAAPSIYDLPVRLKDENGAERSLDSFRGHPVLITMFYGSCPTACPLLTSELKRIEAQIPESARSNLRILMVSFDAARDTPQALARLKKERGLDAGRWTLASAADDEARELAGVLGIRYRKLDGGAFFHSSVIVLLDAQGRPQAKLDGLGQDPAAILAALTAPSTVRPRPAPS